MRDVSVGGERVEWSADSSEDEYTKFKDRKSLKRKRAIASTRKAKAVAKENDAGIGSKKATWVIISPYLPLRNLVYRFKTRLEF